MIQTIYVSVATTPFSADDLERLLQVARTNNEAANVSGMLVHDEGTFLQVLEGEEEDIEPLLARISADQRHAEIVVLWRREIEVRAFGEWRMGFVEASGGASKGIPGYCAFFHPSFFLESEDPDGSKAFDVLCRFRDGAFRRAS
ncbi:MAG: BLUF domain-containing protein [Myxococcota bacterium]